MSREQLKRIFGGFIWGKDDMVSFFDEI